MIDLRIVILFFIGLALYYILIRVIRRGTARERRFGAVLVAPVIALFGTPESLQGKPKAQPFRSAMSPEAFQEVRSWLTSLKQGDLVDISFGTALHPVTEKSIPLADGWLGDYSGRYLSGNPQFGHPIALMGDVLYGNHLFGYLDGIHTLHPAYQLITQAQAAWDLTEAEAVEKGYEPLESIFVGGEPKPLYIKNITVQEVVHLEENWHTDPEMAQMELIERTDQVETMFMEPLEQGRYAGVEAQLENIPIGCERWDMMQRLGGQLVTLMGFDAVMRMDGYLNFIGEHRWSKITPQGVFLSHPFGYLDKRKEMPQQVAIFLNNRLQQLRPFLPKKELEKELGISGRG